MGQTKSTDRVGRKAGLDGPPGSSNVYGHTAAIMSATLDQPDRQQNVTTIKGPTQAVTSLNREYLAVLGNEEVAGIGRAVAQIVRGDGWHEANASAVLVSGLVSWLGADAVQPLGFYANGTGPVEVVARVGHYYITGHGIENEDDLTINPVRGRPRRRGAVGGAPSGELVRPGGHLRERRHSAPCCVHGVRLERDRDRPLVRQSRQLRLRRRLEPGWRPLQPDEVLDALSVDLAVRSKRAARDGNAVGQSPELRFGPGLC